MQQRTSCRLTFSAGGRGLVDSPVPCAAFGTHGARRLRRFEGGGRLAIRPVPVGVVAQWCWPRARFWLVGTWVAREVRVCSRGHTHACVPGSPNMKFTERFAGCWVLGRKGGYGCSKSIRRFGPCDAGATTVRAMLPFCQTFTAVHQPYRF